MKRDNEWADMGREIRCISSSFSSADMLRSATHISGAKMQAAMLRVTGLETHHETQHSRTDFRPLDPFSFRCDFASTDTQSDTWVVQAPFWWPEI
jgi:hypothetical protein